MIIRNDISLWTAADYLEARDIITKVRRNLGIDTEGERRRMTPAEAQRVIAELQRAGETQVIKYIETLYKNNF